MAYKKKTHWSVGRKSKAIRDKEAKAKVKAKKMKLTLKQRKERNPLSKIARKKPKKIERASWWHRMTPAAQKAYKKAHPNSKLKIGK